MPNSNKKIRVLIVDDHPQYRKGLASILEIEPDIETVGQAGNGADAIEQVALLHPDVVLMDVNMPGMDGIEATRRLAESYPDVGVIMLTMFAGEEHLRQARRAGASAYVLKDVAGAVLLQTIRDVVLGEMPLLHEAHHTTGNLPDEAGSQGGPPSAIGLLSANERTILKLLGTGVTNAEIGREVGMSDLMVRTYLEEIYRKLGLSGRDAAAQYARSQEIRD